MTTYRYLGDRLTDTPLKSMICTAVRRPDGKCITGKTGVMLVQDMQGCQHVVLRRKLRKFQPAKETRS